MAHTLQDTNQIACPHFQRTKQLILAHICGQVPMEFFDSRRDCCYCERCTAARGDEELCQVGQPPRPYIRPVGWIYLGLVVPPGLVAKHTPFNMWHNSYHGMSYETMLKIFDSGLHLLLAGCVWPWEVKRSASASVSPIATH